MARQGCGDDDRGQDRALATPDTSSKEPDDEETESERERERVLPRQGREEVAAIDGERSIEEKRQGCGSQRRGNGRPEPEHASHAIGAERHRHRPRDGRQLECQAIGEDERGDRCDQVGQDEVVGVEREAVVPARVPAGEAPVGQQVRPQVRRQSEVGSGVAPGRGGCRDEEFRVELPDRDPDDTESSDESSELRQIAVPRAPALGAVAAPNPRSPGRAVRTLVPRAEIGHLSLRPPRWWRSLGR